MSWHARKSLGSIKRITNEAAVLLLGLIAVCVAVLFYTLSSPVFLLHFVVKRAAKFIRPDLSAIVSPQGNIFSAELFSSRSPRCSLVVSMLIEGHFPETEYLVRVDTMINTKNKDTGKAMYPEYKQYVEKWLGFAFWKEDPHFDIRNHVKIYNNDNRPVTAEELRNFKEELLNKRFHPRRSPWEGYIVNNYIDSEIPAKNKTVGLFRVHHTLADGFSILYSFFEGILQVPLSSIQLPNPTYPKRDKWSELKFRLVFPIHITYDMADYFIKGFRKNPLNILDSKKSWNQIYGTAKPVSIQKVKEIKNSLGVSFTSVLLAAISASMSTVIKSKISKRDELNERAAFFIPLPMPDGHPNAMINHVTGAQIDLPINSFSDPTLRVRDCDLQIKKQKTSTIPWLIHFFGKTLGLQPSFLSGILSANRVNVAGLTNFPVGLDEIKFESKVGAGSGKLLRVDLAAGALTGVAGLAFMAISYNKNIQFSVTAERACLTKKDVDCLLTLLCDEIDLLHKIVSERNKIM